MRIWLATSLLAALVTAQALGAVTREERGNLVLENIPASDPALAERLWPWQQSRGARLLDWLPDGSLLIATRFGDTEQIHRVAHPLGAREQLTFGREPVTVARAPGNEVAKGFVFLSDREGNENAQLFFFSLADRRTQLLTDGHSLHGNPVWAHDGRRVAFHGNARDGVSQDIYVVDVTSGAQPRLVVAANRDMWLPLAWSPDDGQLLLQKYVSVNESHLFVAEVATGRLTAVEAGEQKVGIRSARFAPDGHGIWLVSDRGGEFAQLRFVDPASGEARVVTDHIPWDIEEFDLSRDGRYLAWVANIDGTSRLTVIDQALRLELSPPQVPAGQITDLRFDPGGTRLAFAVETPQSPRDVYVYELPRNELVRWTESEVGPIDRSKLVTAELVRYPTWDRAGRERRMIPAFVYRPRSPGPHPVLIDIHGGPEAQARPRFDAFLQFVVNELGYTVVTPNVRGSSGYGRTWLDLDNGRQREDAVRDIGSLLVWIGLQGDLDRRRVVVRGGSYGGYMALASLVHYGDRLAGGISVVGISNFVTFLRNTAGYRQDLRRAEYGDERDPGMRRFLEDISPLTRARAIRSPLLVVQGLNDPRVPASESGQIVAAVRANGGEAWYLAARDEGHGFRRKPNRDVYDQTVAQFLAHLAPLR
ncbi:MAG: S9 family peptidase [Gammaproteobacteria bacterium]|nr:S9 family peptidase [Gammaproteobacteria bacterium]